MRDIMEQKREQTKVTYKEFVARVNDAFNKAVQATEEFETAVFNHAKAIDSTLIEDLNPIIDNHAGFTIRNEELPLDDRPIKDLNRLVISYYTIENKASFQNLAAIYASAYPDLEAVVTDFKAHQGEHKNKTYFALSFSAGIFLRDVLPNLKASLVPEIKQHIEPETIITLDSYRSLPTDPKTSQNLNSFLNSTQKTKVNTLPHVPTQEEKSVCTLQ
jgi:hypothetical protein